MVSHYFQSTLIQYSKNLKQTVCPAALKSHVYEFGTEEKLDMIIRSREDVSGYASRKGAVSVFFELSIADSISQLQHLPLSFSPSHFLFLIPSYR